MGKEEVKTRLSGPQHCSSTGDFRKSQCRSRRSKERKDGALMGESEFSGAAARDSHVHETATSMRVKTELGRGRAGLHSATTSVKHSKVPVAPGESRAELFCLLTQECLSPTVIDPRQRGGPQAAAVVVKGIAVPVQGMVEVGIIPERGTETFTRGEKG